MLLAAVRRGQQHAAASNALLYAHLLLDDPPVGSCFLHARWRRLRLRALKGVKAAGVDLVAMLARRETLSS